MSRARDLLALAPVVVVSGGLTLAALVRMVADSVGVGEPSGLTPAGFTAYRAVLGADGFGQALAFSLWVAIVGTALALIGAVTVLWLWTSRPGSPRTVGVALLQFNLSIPHIVWSVALAAMLAQSGWLARIGALFGVIDAPADVPVVVNDGVGLGIIVHIATKELPFIVLATLPLAGRQAAPLLKQARLLGARPLQQLRMVFLPALAPAIVPATLVSFAFAIGAFEPGFVLGTQQPRTLAVVALERFRDPDLSARAEAQAISMLLIVIVVVFAWISWVKTRRWITP